MPLVDVVLCRIERYDAQTACASRKPSLQPAACGLGQELLQLRAGDDAADVGVERGGVQALPSQLKGLRKAAGPDGAGCVTNL